MINEMLNQLRKLEDAENIFGEEVMNALEWGTCADAYLVRGFEYPAIELKKDAGFEQNYFSLIHYLTEMKNRHMNGADPENEKSYYRDWLVFKKNYNVRKAWFHLNVKNPDDVEEVADCFVSILGRINYRAVLNSYHTPNEDYRGHARNVMEYVGNSRAVRDLCMKYLDLKVGTQWQFHLWHMTPTMVTNEYGYVFYLGNEMSGLEYCPYDYKAKEYYYDALYRQLYDNMKKDIPGNRHITEEQKEEIWKEICREVLYND